MIILISGLLGSGKTLLCTILGKALHVDDGFKVYSNYKTSFSELIDPFKLLNFKLSNCAILLDEMYTIMDSRDSMTRANKLYSYFFLQTRKLDVHVIGTAQLLGSIEFRSRFIADKRIIAEVYKEQDEKGDLQPIGFEYTEYLREIPYNSFYLDFEKAIPFFKDYDTTEIISPYLAGSIELSEIEEIFKDAPTKKTFVILLRAEIPKLTYDVANTVFDLLKIDRRDKVEEVLARI